MFTLDLNGRVLYANKAARELTGRPGKKIIGKYFMLFLDKPSRVKALKYIREVRKGVEVIRDELHIVNDSRKVIPIEFTMTPIHRKNAVAQLHVSVRNISRRRELEDIARESAKMSAIQHFISGTTHEIQYPLKGLMEQTERLIKTYRDRDFEYIGYKEFSQIFETLETMRDQAEYCYKTTERLLKISQEKAGLNKKTCDANRVIRESILTLKDNIMKADVTIQTRLAKTLPPAAIGEIELGQVMTKIITNAVQALTLVGRIEIRSSYSKRDHKIRIDCVDNGIGISKDDLSRVFDPFFTTKERGLEKSSGLGLAIVYSIIKSYHGTIAIKSNSTDGTRVTLMLPVAKISKKQK